MNLFFKLINMEKSILINNSLKIVLKAISFSLIAIFLVNLAHFLIELSKTDTSESWSFVFKHGTFSLNEKLVGLKLWSSNANGLMLLIFIVTIINEYRKGKLKLK